jgi:hypothetical protein
LLAADKWLIQYEGWPTNPRYQRRKVRAATVIGSFKDAERYARSLVRGQRVKVLSIKPKEA